jgi:hypothetical protein
VWTEGDSTLANADYGDLMNWDCYEEAAEYDALGRDLVYSYSPAADGDFTVVLQPQAGGRLPLVPEVVCGTTAPCASARATAP